MKKEMIECRWRVQFAGSVARKKVVTSKQAMSTNFSTEVVEAVSPREADYRTA
jgi:hypothetical protein